MTATKPSAREARQIAFLLAAAFTLLASVPALYGVIHAPPGSLFLWSADPYDNNGYFKKMRTGYRGDWLTVNLYSAEDHPPVLLFPFHVALGHAARLYRDVAGALTGAPPPVSVAMPIVYEAARVALAMLVALSVFWLAGEIWPSRRRRLWAMAFALFGGGVLWADLNTETNLYKSCALFPNFAISLVLYALACGAALRALRRPRQWKRALAAAAIAGFGLGWIHPFDVPPLGAILGVACLWRWVRMRRLPAAAGGVAAGFLVAAAAPILYQLSIEARVPHFRQMDAQNQLYWNPPWQWAQMLEARLLLALAALPMLWRRRRHPGAMFLIVWLAVGVVMIALPVKFQRRMVEGLPIALGFAGVVAVEGAISRFFRRRRGRARVRVPAWRRARAWALAAVFVALAPRMVQTVRNLSADRLGRPTDLYYLPQGEVEALQWLETHSDWRDVVWADEWRGNVIPFLSGNRVMIGHTVETLDYARKLDWTKRLGTMDLPRANFREIARQFKVRYVYRGFRDRQLIGDPAAFDRYDPETLELVYHNDLARIYRVRADRL